MCLKMHYLGLNFCKLLRVQKSIIQYDEVSRFELPINEIFI